MKLYRNISRLITVKGKSAKKGKEMSELGIIEGGAFVVDDGKFVFVGSESEALEKYGDIEKEDCDGKVVMPGFVDSHTHLIFGGYRAEEFAMRLEGRSYMEIMRQGGGIQSTTTATRGLTARQMAEKTMALAKESLSYGVTTIEIKSGYGLDVKTELSQLEAADILEKNGAQRIVKTYMGAHATPTEFKESGAYIDFICDEVLPKIKKQGIAEFCDAFCEKGVFTKEETLKVFAKAKDLGLKLKIHADEMADGGAATLAADAKCFSADHLLYVSDKGIDALAQSNTVATLLPSTAFSLREQYAPARKLIDGGCAVALGSDCNPGSCFCNSIPLMFALACLNMKMTWAETISALTLNGAAAIDRADSVGSIEEGKLADFLILKWDKPEFLSYHIADNAVKKVYIGGEKVWENMCN